MWDANQVAFFLLRSRPHMGEGLRSKRSADLLPLPPRVGEVAELERLGKGGGLRVFKVRSYRTNGAKGGRLIFAPCYLRG